MVHPPTNVAVSAGRLWSAAREQLAVLFAALGVAESLLIERTFLGLTGGPTADFNMCLADASANTARSLRRAVELARGSMLPTLFMLSANAAIDIGDGPREWGLTPVGEAPLMVFTDASCLLHHGTRAGILAAVWSSTEGRWNGWRLSPLCAWKSW